MEGDISSSGSFREINMFTQVSVFCAVLVAVSCSALVNTGVSSGSRVMDGHGNYAFEYGIASAGAKRSRSEVGSGWAGPIKTSYAVADNHIAPIAPVVAAAPAIAVGGLGYGVGLGGLGYGAGLGAHGLGLGYGAGVIGARGLGLGYGAGVIGARGLGLGYGAGVIGARGLGLGYGAGIVGGHGLGLGYGGVGLLGAGKLL